VTILLVEDSRYASEAMRMLCLRSGARLRRADSLRAARRHLQTYRPTAAIIDLGLPDGNGVELIEDLAQALPRLPVILGFSGALEGEDMALAAGADGFLAKPLTRLAEFQETLLGLLPNHARTAALRALPDTEVTPDALALRDDLAHVSALLETGQDPVARAYSAQFLQALAVCTSDAALAVQRLSYTGHWVVPVALPQGRITLMSFQAAPPHVNDARITCAGSADVTMHVGATR